MSKSIPWTAAGAVLTLGLGGCGVETSRAPGPVVISPQPIPEPGSGTQVAVETIKARAEGGDLRLSITATSFGPGMASLALTNVGRTDGSRRFTVPYGAPSEIAVPGAVGDALRLEEEGTSPFVLEMRVGADGGVARLASCFSMGSAYIELPEIQVATDYVVEVTVENTCDGPAVVSASRVIGGAVDPKPFNGRTFAPNERATLQLPIRLSQAGDFSTLLVVDIRDRDPAALRIRGIGK